MMFSPSFPPDVPVNDILNTFRLFQEIFVSEGEQKNIFGFHQLQVRFERKNKNLEISEMVWLLSLETALDLTASR